MMVENRTCWWRQEGTKGIGQDYFEWSSFSANPIGIHSKLTCHFFKKIAIQNIHPILNANILKCFNFKTLKHLNIKMLKLRS